MTKEALAKEQEPVAWRSPKWSNLHGKYGYRDFDDPVTDINGKPSPYNEPLYTHPQRTWVDLTRTQMQDVYFAVLEEHRGGHQMQGQLAFGEALQAKIKERNT